MKKLVVLALMAMFGTAAPVFAKPGNVEKGAKVYAARCTWCHGEEGDGAGAAAERLSPPPRDFTSAQYKIKATNFDYDFPNDDDVFRMIRDGMPGTAMPGWSDVLEEQEMWDLVALIKTFAGLEEEEPGPPLDYGVQVESSPESIEKGAEIFHDGDRCSECHGQEGKGDAVKGLKDDAGYRTWPRNLTKPWTFRASNDPKDIFTRVSNGIPGTQMPPFADPASDKKLTIEERWHVANYVNSLAKTDKMVNPENTVVKADKVEGKLPDSPDDPQWDNTVPTTFFLVPQIIGKDRFFTPSNDTLTARALYSDAEIAILLEWDDRTESIVGDDRAEKISDPEIAPDAVAVQLPVTMPEGQQKPYFGMGDAGNPVSLWMWRSGTKDQPEAVSLSNSRGFKDIEKRDAAALGLSARGAYKNGTWRVVMKRPLTTGDPAADLQFEEGRFVPIAFAAWDGSNSEKASRHTMTTWYWLLLKPAGGSQPLIAAILVILLIGGAQWWWVRSAGSKAA